MSLDLRPFLVVLLMVCAACPTPASAPEDAALGGDDGGSVADAGLPNGDAGTLGVDHPVHGPDAGEASDAATGLDGATGPDAGGVLDEILARIPNLVICQPGAQPLAMQTEQGSDTTYFHACAAACAADWPTCAQETTARGVSQLEVSFVVDEDGQGRGFGGTLRFTKSGARDRVVLFHKGGAGNEWVDDFLPGKVEAAGGTYVQPKWADVGPGWFARPYAGSRLEHSLYGVSLRVAAVMKWVYRNVSTGPLSTVGCSGGSIATYYPRHWHGLDPILKYQWLSGGPVMSKIQAACSGAGTVLGRCTLSPDTECQTSSDCGANGGTCSAYEWGSGVVMTVVRGTIDHLHANETGGAKDCLLKRPQPKFDVSDFDSPTHRFDSSNEHRIDFMVNVGQDSNADDVLNVVASGAAVYHGLTGPKTWNPILSGAHCDSVKSVEAWNLLQAGAGL